MSTDSTTKPTDTAKEEPQPGYDWTDPTVPIGDAPAMPRWPQLATGVAWAVWILFLAAMAMTNAGV